MASSALPGWLEDHWILLPSRSEKVQLPRSVVVLVGAVVDSDHYKIEAVFLELVLHRASKTFFRAKQREQPSLPLTHRVGTYPSRRVNPDAGMSAQPTV